MPRGPKVKKTINIISTLTTLGTFNARHLKNNYESKSISTLENDPL